MPPGAYKMPNYGLPARTSYFRTTSRMLGRKTFSFAFLAAFSLFILLAVVRRLGTWYWLEEPYYRGSRPYVTQSAAEQDVSGDADSMDAQPETKIPATGATAKENASHQFIARPDMPPLPALDPACDIFPNASNILLIMKTGASEAFDKVPTQLVTVLRCLHDFLIFSDLEQDIGGYHIRDSLDTVLPEAQAANADFDLYRRQKQCVVDQQSCNKLGNPATEGWNLDKYKNNHMAEKTYALRPNYEWYVFVDADSYVLWPNLVRWLGTLDPQKKEYLGSVTYLGSFPFGHGGSGYVVSQASMDAFLKNKPGLANKYDVKVRSVCCGDYMFARALHDVTEISVKNMWPTINGEKPFTLPYGPSHWCHPIVTMHHLNAEELNSFWLFEQRRYRTDLANRPLLIKDIYNEFFAPHLQDRRDDWDNLSDDTFFLDRSKTDWGSMRMSRAKNEEDLSELEKLAHKSFEDCARACEAASFEECFQFKYEYGACAFSRSFKMGKPAKPDGNKDTKSGWDVKKIEKWISEQPTCGSTKWPQVE